MIGTPRVIRPEDFSLIEQIPEISGVARDEHGRIIWHTALFEQYARELRPVGKMLGRTLHQAIPEPAADERVAVYREVMENVEIRNFYQLSRDYRELVTVFPLDEDAFGHQGIMGLVKVSPHPLQSSVFTHIPVLSTPNLAKLDALSVRELEVLHYIAIGMSTHEIAQEISRADKTVEHHINSIHSKLGTTSRPQLVSWASERGIQSFTSHEWGLIVKGAQIVRKSMKKSCCA